MNRLMRTVVRVDSDQMASAAVEESRSPMHIADSLRSLSRRAVASPPVFDSCLVLNLTPSIQASAASWKEVV